MTPQGKEALAVVDRSFTELLDKATTDQIRAKLGNLNEVCRTLVVDVGQRPTVPEVIRHYKGRFPVKGQSLAEQSLRNKRGGTNPYMALLQAWAGAAEFVLAPSRPKRHLPQPNELLSDDDVAGIVDFPLRHQVGLVLAQNRSLKAQLDILKRVGGAPMVRIAAGTEDYGPDGARYPSPMTLP